MTTPVRAVKEYVTRVASIDQEEFPDWDLKAPLQKLPVPDLHKTLSRYLKVLQPIVSNEDYARAQQLVNDFGRGGGEGEFLQQKLQEVAETKENWAYDWWLDDMYMKARLPLPINSNPGMVFPRQYFLDQAEQLRFAARLISGTLDYKTIIDSRGLPIDRANHLQKGQPMCMEQYYRLFSSYRIPGVQKDSIVSSTPTGQLVPEPEHIIVICRNQYFVLDVVVNFMRLSEDNLHQQLQRIVTQAKEEEGDAEMVGLLTSLDRDSWAKARAKLMEDSTNRDALDMIERCIFVLCLDKSIPIKMNHQTSLDEGMTTRDDVNLAKQMIHGQGISNNGANRWFDKTMQFIVGEDGACGLNYEHSPAEGIAVIKLIEHLLRYMDEVRLKKLNRMPSICELPFPRKLRWKLTPDIHEYIEDAIPKINALMDDYDLYVLRYNDFGREFPKSQKMSPDSFIQLALQLTYYKVHGRLTSTYESASLRRFRNGRVDNIRANSMPALAWAKAMVGETKATPEEKMKLMRDALAHQTDFMVQTITGSCMDCHLLGLKELAIEIGRPVPEIFTDSTYEKFNKFPLSTSQVPTSMDAFMCYGAVVPEGYGVAYNPHPNYILVAISSFKSCPDTQSDFFGFTLESSFNQMHELCTTYNETRQNGEIIQTNEAKHVNGSCNDNNNEVSRTNANDQSPRRLVRQKRSLTDLENATTNEIAGTS